MTDQGYFTAKGTEQRVGVSVMLFESKPNLTAPRFSAFPRFLMGKRKGSHGAGTWSFPGGAVGTLESPKMAALREVREETGLDLISEVIHPLEIHPFNSTYFPAAHPLVMVQWITLFYHAYRIEGDPIVMEPERCEEWRWFFWNELPKPYGLQPEENLTLFDPLISLFDAFVQKGIL